MKKYVFLLSLNLLFFLGFKAADKTTASLLGIWINPSQDVKIKIEEVSGQTRAILIWSSKPEAKAHIGRVVIKEIIPHGNNFKAQVIAPERRKYVNGIIEFKSSDSVLITGFDQGKSVSKLYKKVKS